MTGGQRKGWKIFGERESKLVEGDGDQDMGDWLGKWVLI